MKRITTNYLFLMQLLTLSRLIQISAFSNKILCSCHIDDSFDMSVLLSNFPATVTFVPKILVLDYSILF